MLTEGTDFSYKDNKLSIKNNGKWISVDISKYDFLAMIAPGANGVTVKARHRITNKIVAIKIWKPKKNDLSEYRKKFFNEVQKIAKLKHSNIVSIYDAEILESGLCIAVYDYIDGMTLKKWLSTKHKQQQYINVGKKIFEAIVYYQGQNILHGDLHEKNILVTTDETANDENVYIIDFGTSVFSDDEDKKERELYFMMNLIEAIFSGNKCYSKNYFILEMSHRNIGVNIKSDEFSSLLDIEPKLLAETILNYINMMELMTYVNDYAQRDMVEFCKFLGRTYYLDIEAIALYMLENKIKQKMRKYFIAAINEHIEENVFPCGSEDQNASMQSYHASILAYCEMAKAIKLKAVSPIGREIIDNDNIENFSQIVDILVSKLNQWIEIGEEPYFEISPEIRLDTGEEDVAIWEKVREILYFSLVKNFSNIIALHYWISARVHEILCNPILAALVDERLASAR